MELLVENGKTYLKGIVTEANDILDRPRNRNGRIYPKNVLKEAVLKLIERVHSEKVYSYRNHPSHSNLVRNDSAGMLVELTWDDNSARAFGKFEIFEDTTSGKQVLNDLNSGIPYGNSTRALGELDENRVVKSGLNIVTSDLIPIQGTSIQSCQSCTLDLNESIQEFYDDYLIEDCGCGCKGSGDCKYSKLTEIEKNIVDKYAISGILNILKERIK